MNNVELKIYGKRYFGWKNASVSRALNSFASDFTLTVAGKAIGNKTSIPLDAPCQIFIEDELAFSGYVEDVEPNYNATTHEVKFSGRSKTCDLVDCSAIFETGQILNGTPQELIQRIIKPFNIKLIYNADNNTPIPDFQLQPGETASSAIERICSANGLVFTDDAQGNLVITKVGKGNSVGVLIHKIEDESKNNILSATYHYSRKDRFRDYYVKSQLAGTDFMGGEDITAIEGHATDTDIPRYRPLVLTAEATMDAAVAQTRANWEKSSRCAKALSADYKIFGWRNAQKKLWAPNSFVSVNDDFANLSGQLIISKVRLSIGSDGTTSDLHVAPPEAFILSSAKEVIKTYAGWKELKEGVKE